MMVVSTVLERLSSQPNFGSVCSDRFAVDKYVRMRSSQGVSLV